MIDVEDSLTEAGVDPAAATISVVDTIESAAASMVGCAVGGHYAWLERRAGATAEHDRAVATAVGDLLRMRPDEPPDGAGVATVLPFVTAAAVAVYQPLPGPSLLAAPLVLARAVDEERWRRLAEDCERLGSYLARLHRLGRRTLLPAALARPVPAIERVGRLLRGTAPQPAAALDQLQGLLFVEEPELTRALLARLEAMHTTAPKTLLHGQFGAGAVVLSAEESDPRLAVIGWLDAGGGPPAVDLGNFIGELLALASSYPPRAAALEVAARRFVAAYRESAEPQGLDEAIAAIGIDSAIKLVHQMLLHCTYFGFRADQVAAMAGVARAASQRDWTEEAA